MPTSIRFPPPLRDRIAARAAAERRTFSNQVIVLVETSLTASRDETSTGPAPSPTPTGTEPE